MYAPELSATHGLRVSPAPAPEWAALEDAGTPLFATARWLRMMGNNTGGDRYSFLLAEGDGPPSAGMVGTVLRDPEAYEAYNLHQILARVPPVFPLPPDAEAARRAVAGSAPPAEAWFPNLAVMYPGYHCAPVGPGAGDPAVVGRLADGMVRWAAAQGLRAAAFLYQPPGEHVLERALPDLGFHRISLTSRSVLRLPGRSFQDYLGALSRNRRRDVRKERRRLAESGVALRMEPLAGNVADAVRLRCLLQRKYGHRADEARERDRLGRLHDAFGDAAFLVAARTAADAPLLGFTLFIACGDTWHAFMTGTDYGHPLSRYVYFGTAFYTPIELAYGRGIRTIDYGIGHEETKLPRGCQAAPLTGWVRALVPELERTVAEAARIMAPPAAPGGTDD